LELKYKEKMNDIKIKAPAKINLSLQVLNKRQDGFHNINSIFVPIYNLYDEIEISKSSSLEFNCNVDLGISNEKNIAYKAAKMMIEKYKLSPNFKLNLIKQIPSGGGLGGGSSDAASVIKGLCKYYNLDLDFPELLSIAEQLGSDVPFFIGDSAAIVQGRGEILEFIDFEIPYEIVIIAPNFGISTAKAYQKLNKQESNDTLIIDYHSAIPKILTDPKQMKNYFVNDFVHNDMEHYKEINKIINILYENGAIYSNMSGSGSCCYGIYLEAVNINSLENSFPSEYKCMKV